MFKVTTPAGVFTAEKPNFIKKHTNGCFVLCKQEEAEGVAHNGTPYLFEDGASVHEVDGGSLIDAWESAIERGLNL